MHFLLEKVDFQPAMLVYQKVTVEKMSKSARPAWLLAQLEVSKALVPFWRLLIHRFGTRDIPWKSKGTTLPETNISPENGGPLDFWRFRTWKPSFLGAFAVSFRGGIKLGTSWVIALFPNSSFLS